MKKDILYLPMEDISVVAKPIDDDYQWQIILVNHSNHLLQKIMISTTGYGVVDESALQTSTLRHFFEELAPNRHQIIERIDPSVFGLENEYWVSCWINEQLIDKRFIFAPDSIHEEYLNSVGFYPEPVVVAT